MTGLIGMTDELYFEILDEVPEIQYLIVAAGGMATKTAVEEILMIRHNLDRSDAHTFVNLAESRRDFMIRSGKVVWQAKRPQPTIEKYPEFEKL